MPELPTDTKRHFRRQLRQWYRRHRRDLPWRASRDPYRVWVSEIMLQQTQVATVRDYFTRFVTRFATVEALAAASEVDVLRLWEGLGYYRRARQLHAAAREIVDRFGGEFPRDVILLQSLPGIGRYTAGAIASIAFDERAPILEANTERLLARVIALTDAATTARAKRTLWGVAESLLPQRNIGEFNQALMELGSLVCTPREPRCDECPVRSLCQAHLLGVVAEIPATRPRQVYESVHEAAVVIRAGGKVLLRQCGDAERWAGLWDFPRVPLDVSNGTAIAAQLPQEMERQFGLCITPGERLLTIKHGVTRFRITLTCYAATLKPGRHRRIDGRNLKWIHHRDLTNLPLNTTGRKIANSLAEEKRIEQKAAKIAKKKKEMRR
jgi:A/G-specific adenine glycosylase